MIQEIEPARMRDRYFARSRQTVAMARQFTAETLDVWGVTQHRDDLLLCVSELAGNALRHGVPPGRYYRVRLRRYEGGLRLEVHDSGPGLSRTRVGDGYGLRIVEAVSDRWGVLPRQPGKSVWCEFGAPANGATGAGTGLRSMQGRPDGGTGTVIPYDYDCVCGPWEVSHVDVSQ
ncbi:ATP-binding protein [Streptomyces sp. 2P-4]|uniref:ATP-binding protein n=1 Tax=Streptomyces sp. 2P-4 TaxID=2931974 RepID=UPI0032EE6D5F